MIRKVDCRNGLLTAPDS